MRKYAVAAVALFAALFPQQAQADGAPPTVSVPELTVVSWNICGEAGGQRGQAGYCPYRNEPAQKIEQLAQVVAERQADVVMLQEVCGQAPGSHMDLLQQKLGSAWSIRHAVGARPDGRTDCRGGLTGELGVLIAVKGTVTATFAENTLPAGADRQTLPALCVKVQGWATTPCTTHLLPGDETRAAEQVRNVKAFLAAHAPGDTILGGDLNRNADAAALRPLTSTMERCIDDNTYHGWNSDTQQHSYHKLDHLLVSRPSYGTRFVSCAVDTSRMDQTPNEPTSGPPSGYSDHAPVIGTFRGAPVPGDMTGDGRPDLVAVDTAGRLRLYDGLGNGGVTGGHRVIGTRGWLNTSVTHRGDFTGDGREDVVARVGGELRVYPNTGNGALTSPTVIRSGLPADARFVGVGDATGDGHPDLVATYDDKLWLYAGDPAARPGVRAPVEIGSRGWNAMTLTAPGDADGDGRPDLLARDTGDARLWLYRGLPGGGFDDRTEYGHGYDTTTRPLLAGAADADGNGVADMWTTTDSGTGTLMFYAGGTDTAGNPTDGARSTVGASGWDSIVLIA
ncbi:FG-GAP-like repeat-containing protein [Streptomyces coelicoflavus]|uniref:FG-GAP-like repeat-containing protein n=1 Tax=Streptomyces TaxID=1883 RepID=UPI0024ADF681|nr:FG-GAP-like repeat-containing protein [Streptomyces coelicoflavus]MDI6518044.1 FG-GAP-like repeat-containing protein [Streptomyces coelicoflavus]